MKIEKIIEQKEKAKKRVLSSIISDIFEKKEYSAKIHKIEYCDNFQVKILLKTNSFQINDLKELDKRLRNFDLQIFENYTRVNVNIYENKLIELQFMLCSY